MRPPFTYYGGKIGLAESTRRAPMPDPQPVFADPRPARHGADLGHTAVLLAWVGPAPAGHEGRHVNGDTIDNRAENLTWSTHAVNIADKHAHGTMSRPGRAGAPVRVLTEADVAEMRQLWPAVSIRALAARFGVGRTTAGDVVRGKSWREVSA